MNIETLMKKSGAYVVSERHRHNRVLPEPPRLIKPSITIAHQTGSGAREIAEELAGVLRKSDAGEPGGWETWEIYDHQLIEKALQQQSWPKKLAEKITEEKRFFIDELMDDLFSIRPPSWVLMPQVVETTLSLAMSGHAILVGHGATVVTAKLPNVFHLRLTGSLPRRIERIQKLKGLTPRAAGKFVQEEDRKREKYLKAHFHARLNNELLYDLAINTDRTSNADAVAIISEAAKRFFATL